VRKRRGKPKWFLRQYTCKSDRCQVFFAGVDKIFYNLTGLPAPVQKRCAKPTPPRAIIPATGSRVKYYLHVWGKFIIIREVSATGAKIVENWGKLQIILDKTTPRAAPRNSLAFFSRMVAKLFDNGCNCWYNRFIN